MPLVTMNAEMAWLRITEMTRLAAVGDLHCPRTSSEKLHRLFGNVAEQADILFLL